MKKQKNGIAYISWSAYIAFLRLPTRCSMYYHSIQRKYSVAWLPELHENTTVQYEILIGCRHATTQRDENRGKENKNKARASTFPPTVYRYRHTAALPRSEHARGSTLWVARRRGTNAAPGDTAALAGWCFFSRPMYGETGLVCLGRAPERAGPTPPVLPLRQTDERGDDMMSAVDELSFVSPVVTGVLGHTFCGLVWKWGRQVVCGTGLCCAVERSYGGNKVLTKLLFHFSYRTLAS